MPKTNKPRIIYEFNKNANEVVRVQLVKYDNRELLDIRVWVLKDGGDYIPTRKGVAIRLEQVDSLKQAINKVAEEIEKAQEQG
jgi:predicted transcriptional regulator